MPRILTADTALIDLIVDEVTHPELFAALKQALTDMTDEKGNQPFANAFDVGVGIEKYSFKGSRNELVQVLRKGLGVKADEDLGKFPLFALLQKMESLGLKKTIGGSASNTLSTVTETFPRGHVYVKQLCGLGKGPLSDLIRSSFDSDNYHFAPTSDEKGECPFSLVLNGKDGQRRLFTHPGKVKEMTTKDACDQGINEPYDVVLLSGSLTEKMPEIYKAMLKRSEEPNSKGVRPELYASLPTKQEITDAHHEEILDLVSRSDVFLGNAPELSWLAHRVDPQFKVISDEQQVFDDAEMERQLEWLQQHMKPGATALITKGKYGTALISNGEITHFPIWSKDIKIVSKTGGGDAAFGGFLAGHIDGLSAAHSSHMAMAYGAACIQSAETRIEDPKKVYKHALVDPRLKEVNSLTFAQAHGGFEMLERAVLGAVR